MFLKFNFVSSIKALFEMLLIRLRLLGNFDIAKLSLNDFFEKKIFFVEKEEMEKVSNYLENFYVIESF